MQNQECKFYSRMLKGKYQCGRERWIEKALDWALLCLPAPHTSSGIWQVTHCVCLRSRLFRKGTQSSIGLNTPFYFIEASG